VLNAADIGNYDERLIEALTTAIGSGRALRMDPFAVVLDAFPDEASAANERRCIEATIRKHFDHGVDLGLFEGRCAIAWHPETGAPQVFAVQPRPEQKFLPAEEALSLIGAHIADAWDPGASPLTGDTFLDLVTGDDGAPADRHAAERLTLLAGGMLSQFHDLLLCVALLHRLDPLQALQRFALVDRELLGDLCTIDVDQHLVEAVRNHVAALFATEEGPQ